MDRLRMGTGWWVLGVLAIFVAGIAVGVLLRPYLGQLLRNVRGPADAVPQPLLPSLWASKTGQFRVIDGLPRGPAIVYLGDSLTDWMMVHEFVQYKGGRVLNRGINGDTTSGVLVRISDCFAKDTRLCFLLIGYNDLLQGASPDEAADRTSRICKVLVEKHRVKHVVIESVLPDATRPDMGTVRHNTLLRQVSATDPNLSYLDLYPSFLKNGQQDASLFADHGHLNERGMLRRIRLEMDHLARIAPDLREALTVVAEEPR